MFEVISRVNFIIYLFFLFNSLIYAYIYWRARKSSLEKWIYLQITVLRGGEGLNNYWQFKYMKYVAVVYTHFAHFLINISL